VPGLAGAAQSVTLPAWVCQHPDAIHVSGFEIGEIAVPHLSSNGSGGAIGSVTRTLHIANLGSGTQPYYLYVPANYTPNHAWPFLLALHGVSPYPDTYAQTTRDDWSSVAAANGLIVAAPIANEQVAVGGQPGVTWRVPPTSGPNDYDEFAAVLADVEGAYNVERTRIYGWGFSAGGHVMHDLGVNTYSAAFNTSTMAAYGVSAGVLAGLACQNLSNAQCQQLLTNLPRKITVDIHIGNNDPLVTDAQSDDQAFKNAGWQYSGSAPHGIYYTIFVGGHTYTVSQLSQIWGNLCRAAVVP
jgi:poly(3-hydroxybutyrate) depolymerase